MQMNNERIATDSRQARNTNIFYFTKGMPTGIINADAHLIKPAESIYLRASLEFTSEGTLLKSQKCMVSNVCMFVIAFHLLVNC